MLKLADPKRWQDERGPVDHLPATWSAPKLRVFENFDIAKMEQSVNKFVALSVPDSREHHILSMGDMVAVPMPGAILYTVSVWYQTKLEMGNE
jgi:hypothetical protein